VGLCLILLYHDRCFFISSCHARSGGRIISIFITFDTNNTIVVFQAGGQESGFGELEKVIKKIKAFNNE